MSFTIYHNPRCGKSRNTLAILQENGLEVKVVEYLKDIPSKAELKMIISKLGITPLDLIRTGEEIFKTNYKGKNLSDSQWLDAMIANPILIERPIVVKGDKAIIGRPPEKVLELI